MTSLSAAFFIIPQQLAPANAANRPPIALAILLPAIVLGIGAMVQYLCNPLTDRTIGE